MGIPARDMDLRVYSPRQARKRPRTRVVRANVPDFAPRRYNLTNRHAVSTCRESKKANEGGPRLESIDYIRPTVAGLVDPTGKNAPGTGIN
jgi:hypothetical protein